MNVLLHQSKYANKDCEIIAFPRTERMLKKEWNDHLEQLAPAAHAIGCSIAMIDSDDSTTEVLLNRVQQADVALVLHDGELREHLAAHPHAGMR